MKHIALKRTSILLLIPVLLAVALYSAVARIGWNLPLPALPVNHGFLMVSGLFGTLISLERTFPLTQKLWLSIPLLSSIAAVWVVIDHRTEAYALQVVASVLLSFLYLKQWYRFREVFLLGLVLSGLCWAMSGVVLLMGQSYPAASMWYILFLLFTITSERLELSKFIATPGWAKPLLLLIFALLFLVQALPFHWGSNHYSGIFIAGIAYWLLSFDIVNINLRKKGFFYYTGSTLYGGYLWLMLSGVLMALPLNSFYHYDAVLHSFFIGFVFMMLYAHAPIIFPALVGITAKPFHKFLYFPVAATHLLLLIRIYADYTGNFELRKWTGILQVAIMLSFFGGFAVLMLKERSRSRKRPIAE